MTYNCDRKTECHNFHCNFFINQTFNIINCIVVSSTLLYWLIKTVLYQWEVDSAGVMRRYVAAARVRWWWSIVLSVWTLLRDHFPTATLARYSYFSSDEEEGSYAHYCTIHWPTCAQWAVVSAYIRRANRKITFYGTRVGRHKKS